MLYTHVTLDQVAIARVAEPAGRVNERGTERGEERKFTVGREPGNRSVRWKFSRRHDSINNNRNTGQNDRSNNIVVENAGGSLRAHAHCVHWAAATLRRWCHHGGLWYHSTRSTAAIPATFLPLPTATYNPPKSPWPPSYALQTFIGLQPSPPPPPPFPSLLLPSAPDPPSVAAVSIGPVVPRQNAPLTLRHPYRRAFFVPSFSYFRLFLFLRRSLIWMIFMQE